MIVATGLPLMQVGYIIVAASRPKGSSYNYQRHALN